MVEIFLLLGLVLVVGGVFLLLKLCGFFILLPLKIGLGVGKILFGIIIGIPVLIVGGLLVSAVFPLLLVLIPVLCLLALLALPLILFLKLVF